MARSSESQPSAERKSGFLSTWKKFNTVSAAVLATAGVVFEQLVLLGLAAIDILQNYVIGRFEKWRVRRKAGKALGGQALRGARLQPV